MEIIKSLEKRGIDETNEKQSFIGYPGFDNRILFTGNGTSSHGHANR
jgi:hypothetical protein